MRTRAADAAKPITVLLCPFCTHPNEKCTQFPNFRFILRFFGWVHGTSFPPIVWVQKASHVAFPLFSSSGWVHDKTAAACRAGSRFILGAYEEHLFFQVTVFFEQVIRNYNKKVLPPSDRCGCNHTLSRQSRFHN